MKVTFFGTSTLLFDDGEDQILFDAHFTRPSLFRYLFGTLSTDVQIVEDILKDHDMSRLRAIFVSHSHHDHVIDAPYLANRFGAVIYGSVSTLNVGRGGDVSAERLCLFDPASPVQIGDFSVRVLPSVHSKPKFFNNDLGQTIDEPLIQPAKKSAYKEGGSYDFLITHREKNYLIRASFNYLKGELEGIHADVAFLGITGISNESEAFNRAFFSQTVELTGAKTVIPLHWDNFFRSLQKPVRGLPRISEDTKASFFCLTEYCRRAGVNCTVQLPLTTIEI